MIGIRIFTPRFQLQIVGEARSLLARSPRSVRWGPLAIMAWATHRAEVLNRIASGGQARAHDPDLRNIVDIWGIPIAQAPPA
jgi:hypothetical protein